MSFSLLTYIGAHMVVVLDIYTENTTLVNCDRQSVAEAANRQAYLPGTEETVIGNGGTSTVRPFHCTTVGLKRAIIPNVDDSGAQFMLVGDCVRAIP